MDIKAYKDRWDRINAWEIREQRKMTIDDRLKQLDLLYDPSLSSYKHSNSDGIRMLHEALRAFGDADA